MLQSCKNDVAETMFKKNQKQMLRFSSRHVSVIYCQDSQRRWRRLRFIHPHLLLLIPSAALRPQSTNLLRPIAPPAALAASNSSPDSSVLGHPLKMFAGMTHLLGINSSPDSCPGPSSQDVSGCDPSSRHQQFARFLSWAILSRCFRV